MKIKNNRNYGIDFLKIISMFMIVTMHVLSWGGIMESLEIGSAKYYLVWLIESIAYVAVNVYALISGYLNVQKEFRIKKAINLWLQVAFYTIIFTVIFQICNPADVSLKSWVKAFFPVIFNQYWYFTAYFIVYLFSPYFNSLLNNLSKKQSTRMIILLVIIFSVIPTIRCYDIFGTDHGYSVIWLSILYLIGGYVKLHIKNISKKTKIKLSIIWAVSTIFTALSKYIVDIFIKGKIGLVSDLGLLDYTSITVVVSSLCLFIIFIFSDYISKFKKIISFLSPLTFGVYLIHVNYFIWNFVLKSRFTFVADYNIFVMTVLIFLIISSIYICCSFVEYLRKKIFKIFKFDAFALAIEKKISNTIAFVEKRII